MSDLRFRLTSPAECSRDFASVFGSMPVRPHPEWHWSAVTMASSDPGSRPRNNSYQQQGGSDRESKDDRTARDFDMAS